MPDSNEWWRGCVIYQIYPRSYLDTNGDGIGDLNGVTAKLDYLRDLGVDAIWLSPFFKSPMHDFGYDVSDYRDIDPMFGTLRDFDRLVEETHKRGLKLIIDQVISHTSNQHPWFIESASSCDNAKADWYVWVDAEKDGTPPNNWLSNFGGQAWEWNTKRMQYYLHHFLASQPDLNFYNPEVRAALLDVFRFWLDRGVDGFRLDTVNYYYHDAELRSNPPLPEGVVFATAPLSNPYSFQDHIYDKTRPENLNFLEDLRRLTDSYQDRMLVGELGVDGPDVGKFLSQYTEKGKRLHMAYVFELLTEQYSAEHIKQVTRDLTKAIGNGWICWSVGNHDVARVISRWGLEPYADRAAPLIFAMMLSLRGSSCVYEGEELGLSEAIIPYESLQDPYGIALWPEFKGRDGCRTPMPWEKAAPNGGFSTAKPWLPVPPEHLDRAVDVQEKLPESVLVRFRKIAAWRKTQPLLRDSDINYLDSPESTLAFTRGGGNDGEILCLFNMSPEKKEIPITGQDWEPIEGHTFTGKLDNGKAVLEGFAAGFYRMK
ncbi:MAG: alpha-glucosidase [Planctomycetes bacterium]|nr:alpha-glucosidase [Planctomycetota bacterium]